MSKPEQIEQTLLLVLDHLLLEHPLPWRIDRDWTYEVLASDNTVIAKCKEYSEAEFLLQYAVKRRAYTEEACAEVNRRLELGPL